MSTWLDPNSDSTCGRCLSYTMYSYVVAYVNIILYLLTLINISFKTGYFEETERSMTTTEIVFTIIIILICLAFSIMLLIGLHKDRRSFIKIFLVFCAVLTVLGVLAFVTNLFMQPARIGFTGFLMAALDILLNCFTFIVIRSYYLKAYT